MGYLLPCGILLHHFLCPGVPYDVEWGLALVVLVMEVSTFLGQVTSHQDSPGKILQTLLL